VSAAKRKKEGGGEEKAIRNPGGKKGKYLSGFPKGVLPALKPSRGRELISLGRKREGVNARVPAEWGGRGEGHSRNVRRVQPRRGKRVGIPTFFGWEGRKEGASSDDLGGGIK